MGAAMTESILGVGLVVGLAFFYLFYRGRQLRLKEEAKRISASRSSVATVASACEPSSFRVEDLGYYLDARKRETETEAQTEKDRLQRLQGVWDCVAPLVLEAIEMVNAKLNKHHMRLTPSCDPQFFNDANNEAYGFGVAYDLRKHDVPMFDGGHEFVATDRMLDVVNIGTVELPLKDLSSRSIADATAESVKWYLEG